MRRQLDLACPPDQPTDPADRRDQLGDGGVQHPPTPTPQHPGLLHDLTDRLQDPPRPIRAAQPRPPVHQHRGWNPSSSSRSPQATFQAISRRSALIASRSDRPSRACSTITVAITCAGTDGCRHPGGRYRQTAQAGTGAGGGRLGRRTPTRRGSGGGTRSPRPAGHRVGDWQGSCRAVCPLAAPSANDRIGTANRPNHAHSAAS
jgi:hypothetical protein